VEHDGEDHRFSRNEKNETKVFQVYIHRSMIVYYKKEILLINLT
jgi:hypothetical protein